MKMINTYFKLPLALLLCATAGAQAAVVNIAGQPTNSIERSVTGVYSSSLKISFSEAGKYELNFSDLPGKSEFSLFGAAISDKDGKSIGSLVVDDGVLQKAAQFSLGQGEYDLSLFAITYGDVNFGTFKLDVNSVPLPPAIIGLTSALMWMGALMRRRRTAK